MPKIIVDIENKILTAAETLFSARGFEETDMRQIAKQAGIAVGTIYQYYRDKQDLYQQVISFRWSSTLRKLEEISKQDRAPEELLTEMLAVLSRQVCTLSIWKEIAALYTQHVDKNTANDPSAGTHAMFSQLFGRVIKRIAPSGAVSTELANQLGSFAFVMTADLSHLPPDAAVGQSQLIADLLVSYLAINFPKDTT